MQKFSSLFTEDGEAGGAAPSGSSTPPSNVSSDIATTGLQRKVTHDELMKEKKDKSFKHIFSSTWKGAKGGVK